jgi:fibro-slime domain-containing protein
MYPPSWNKQVTYFDFHPDGSCPDFNPGTNPSLLLKGMIAGALGSDSLPVRGDSILYSFEVEKWFRPWRQGNDFERPVYSQNGRSVANVATALFDTSYKNMVFNDTLTFTYVPGSAGLYRYSSAAFWPLDNRGYGNEPAKGYNGTLISPAPHNYSFAMHMKSPFQYAAGLTLAYGGNDDIWVFVNHKLALDLGGIHGSALDSIVLDSGTASKFGLVKDGIYDLDIFYAQRQADRSSIVLTAPIIAPVEPPRLSLHILLKSDTMFAAGDSIPMFAIISDDTGGIHTDLEALVQWQLAPAGTRSYLRSTQGGTNMLYNFQPYTMFCVIITWQYPGTFQFLRDSAWFYVRPLVPTKLYIESDTVNCSGSGTSFGCMAPSPLDSIVFSGAVVQKTAVAIMRDSFGNFAGYSATGGWKFLSGGAVARVSFPSKPYIALIEAVKPGTAFMEVTDTTATLTKKDTLKIVVKDDIVPVRYKGRTLESLGKSKKPVSEFFNLRGQRLPSNMYGIARADGIVLERVIEPTGKVSMKKSFVPNP